MKIHPKYGGRCNWKAPGLSGFIWLSVVCRVNNVTALLGSQLTDGIMRQSAFTSDHDYCTTNDTRSGHQHPQNISTKVVSISDLSGVGKWNQVLSLKFWESKFLDRDNYIVVVFKI